MKFKKRPIPVATETTTLEDFGGYWKCYDHYGRQCTIYLYEFNNLPEKVTDISWDSLKEMLLSNGFTSWTAGCMYEEVKPCAIKHGAWTCREDAGHDGNHKDSGVTWGEPEFKTYQRKFESVVSKYENGGIKFSHCGEIWWTAESTMRLLPIVIGAADWAGVYEQARKKVRWIPPWAVERIYVECDGPAKIEVNTNIVKKFSMMVDGKMKFPTPEELNDQRPASGVAREVAKAIELGKAYGASVEKCNEIAARVYRELKPRHLLSTIHPRAYEILRKVARRRNYEVERNMAYAAIYRQRTCAGCETGVSNVASAPEFKFHRGARITYSED